MKLHLIGLVVAVLGAVVLAKNLPLKPRSFGNFVPDVKKSFTIFKASEQISLNSQDPVQAAVEFFASKTASSVAETHVASFHTAGHSGVTHVYLQQLINGIPVVNGVGNVNVGPKGQIQSFGSSFFNGKTPAAGLRPQHSVAEAQQALEALIGSKAGHLATKYPAALNYIQLSNGKLTLAWNFVYETPDNMYNAIVDVTSNTVVQLVDWVSDASYNVFPLGINDPLSGERELLVDPHHAVASPLGWHSQGEGEDSTFTIGNNVYAQENIEATGDDWENNYRPDGGAALTFDFPLDLTLEPEEYIDASVTNLFYWNNIIHDLFYNYGFDEAAGNFQENNFDLGGAGNDAVQANAQNGVFTNNADFLTPPDGERPRMRMYVWTQTTPRRDGDLEGGIVFHEYLHGISIRLTGGPSNVGCLSNGESGGMGEGWGDTFATVTRVTAETTRDAVYAMGDYSNGGEGIRYYPYSTNLETNPSTYNYVTRPGCEGVHGKGEVWAVILYEVFWNLVEKHGFQDDWFDAQAENPGGNVIFTQIVVDGLKIQPCLPNFVDARDAIIQADQNNYNGENLCELWQGFAKRGLGTGAAFPGVENFDVPAECQ